MVLGAAGPGTSAELHQMSGQRNRAVMKNGGLETKRSPDCGEGKEGKKRKTPGGNS